MKVISKLVSTIPRKLIKPRTFNQEHYVNSLNSNTPIVFALGPAGTGKTLLASQTGIQQIVQNKFERIVLTRPASTVGETHGFLPGDINKKMYPWIQPVFDSFAESISYDEIERLKKRGIIEIAPLAFMRGRTFNNSWIIADEMQNSSFSQLKMLLTRLGQNSKLIITGDLAQCDIDYNSLHDFIHHASNKDVLDYIEIINLNDTDIIRHKAIAEVLSIFDDFN